MSIEDRQSEVIELFEEKREVMLFEDICTVEEGLDEFSEMYENDVDNDVLDECLDNIREILSKY